MSTQTDYTPEEWFLISTLSPMIGSVVAAIDKSGIVGTFKEMSASMQAGAAALRDHENNELIQAVVQRKVSGFKEAMADAQAKQKALLERVQEKGLKSPEQYADQVVEDCANVNGILAAKSTPEEAAEFKEWTCSIGQAVAEAAKEGGLLGIGSGSVSDKEAELLGRIRTALAI